MKIKMIISVVAISFAFVDRTNAGVSRAQMEHLAGALRRTCVRKVQANITLVEGIRNGQFPEGNTALKCYTKCVMILMKTLKNNMADLDTLEKQIKVTASDDIADRLIDASKKCYSKINEKDVCEYTWKYTICTYKLDPEVFFSMKKAFLVNLEKSRIDAIQRKLT